MPNFIRVHISDPSILRVRFRADDNEIILNTELIAAVVHNGPGSIIYYKALPDEIWLLPIDEGFGIIGV